MRAALVVLCCFLLAGTSRAGAEPSAASIVEHMLESDPWGLSGAAVAAHATLTDKGGTTSTLAFNARSKRIDGPLSASIVRFSAPADLNGSAFLQIQKKQGDDERFLYLPDLGRSRRISGNLRKNPFMGTDMSFADLDRRDIRDGSATIKGSEKIGSHDCHVLSIVPSDSASQYSRLEIWVRKDNFLPLKMEMYDQSKVLLKTFSALEVKRIDGQWFVTKSRMTNVQQNHSTVLVLDSVVPSAKFTEADFTVRELEKAQ